MKQIPLLLAGLLLAGRPAAAQVIINHAALEQLAGIAPPAMVSPLVPAAPPPVVRHVTLRRRVVRKPAPVIATIARPAAPLTATPVVARPVIAPAAPPKPAPPAAAAIAFAPGSADLPGGAAAALHPFCAAPGTIIVSAAAPADPSDPSSAMRLAMMRAFAVRGALVACGTPTASILPRTVAATPGRNPDIAEVNLTR